MRHSQETSPDLDHDLSLHEVHQAYDRVRGRQLGSAVFISDLATELQIVATEAPTVGDDHPLATSLRDLHLGGG